MAMAIGAMVGYILEFIQDQKDNVVNEAKKLIDYFFDTPLDHRGKPAFYALFALIILLTLLGIVGAILQNFIVLLVFGVFYTILIFVDGLIIGEQWVFICGSVAACWGMMLAVQCKNR